MDLQALKKIVEKGLRERKVFEDAKDLILEIESLEQSKKEAERIADPLREEVEKLKAEKADALEAVAMAKAQSEAMIADAVEKSEIKLHAAQEATEIASAKIESANDSVKKTIADSDAAINHLRQEISDLADKKAESVELARVAKQELDQVNKELEKSRDAMRKLLGE